MKYQVQKYEVANMDNREVIATHTGVMNETEQAAFYGKHTVAPIADTHKYALIPDNHQWFETTDPDPSVTTLVADVMVSDKPVAGVMEDKPVAYEDMIRQVLDDNQKQRQEQVDRDEKVRDALAQLSK